MIPLESPYSAIGIAPELNDGYATVGVDGTPLGRPRARARADAWRVVYGARTTAPLEIVDQRVPLFVDVR